MSQPAQGATFTVELPLGAALARTTLRETVAEPLGAAEP